jgi:hypothetical protein
MSQLWGIENTGQYADRLPTGFEGTICYGTHQPCGASSVYQRYSLTSQYSSHFVCRILEIRMGFIGGAAVNTNRVHLLSFVRELE